MGGNNSLRMEVWLWTLKLRLGPQANLKKEDIAPVAFCTWTNPCGHTSIEASPGLPTPASSQPTPQARMHRVGTSKFGPCLTSTSHLPTPPHLKVADRSLDPHMTCSSPKLQGKPEHSSEMFRKTVFNGKEIHPTGPLWHSKAGFHNLAWTNLELSSSTPRVTVLGPPGVLYYSILLMPTLLCSSWVAHLLISHLTYAPFPRRSSKEISNLHFNDLLFCPLQEGVYI